MRSGSLFSVLLLLLSLSVEASAQIASAEYKYISEAPSHTYFLLVFNGRDMRVVTSRSIPTIGILNLRDIGGYMTSSGEQVRWGMIFRSGDLWRSFEQDIPTISALGIRTQLTLSPSRISDLPPKLGISSMDQIYVVPDSSIDFQQIIDDIYQGKCSVDDVQKLQRESFMNIAFENPNQLRIILSQLSNPANYPILLSDDLGKDRVAFVTLLLHHILGVSKSDALGDFMLSNDLLPVMRIEPNGYTQPAQVQEALTAYFRCTQRQFNEVVDEIVRRFGSMDKYITDHLRFSPLQQEKLRNILLY